MKNLCKTRQYFFSFLFLFALMFNTSLLSASAAEKYDPSAALNYAQNHWNDGVGLCSEFVSNCLAEGGCSAWSYSASALYRQLIQSGLGTEYEIALENGRINGNNYPGKIAPGDAVFYYCSGCTDGKPYIHVVLCNGFDSAGYMKAFSHNAANSGSYRYTYPSRCYACNTRISTAYVYHFNSYKTPFAINFEKNEYQMDKDSSITLPFTFSGDGIYTMSYAFSNSDIVQVNSWGNTDWTNGNSSLNIKALKAGNTQLTIKLLDNTMQILYEQSIPITVNEVVVAREQKNEFSVTFANKRYSLAINELVNTPFTFSGDGIYTMQYEVTTPGVIEVVSWGNTDWTNGTSSVDLKTIGEGYTRLKIKLLDQNMETLYSKTLPITVGW